MNDYFKQVVEKYGLHKYVSEDCQSRMEHLYTMMVYDFLGELTNDDSLGVNRIETIERLAKKYQVNIQK